MLRVLIFTLFILFTVLSFAYAGVVRHEGFSGGSMGQKTGICEVKEANSTTEASGCNPAPGHAKAGSFNAEQYSKVSSFVNLFSRQYQDEEVDMVVKVPGGKLKVYRVHNGGKWRFEHEYNRLDLSSLIMDKIKKSNLTYHKKDDGLFYYKTFTLEAFADHYRWENKREDYYRKSGAYSLYSKEGLLTESGNKKGVKVRYVYSGEKLISINDRNNTPIYFFEHNSQHKIVKATDAKGRQVAYGWNGDNLLSVTKTFGDSQKTMSYTYNPAGKLIVKTKEDGQKVFLTYHPDGAVKSVITDKGDGQSFSYRRTRSGGQYAKVTSTKGDVQEFWYYANGKTEKIKKNGKLVKKNGRPVK